MRITVGTWIGAVAVGIVVVGATGVARAAIIDIKNPGFELPSVGSGADTGNAQDWETPTSSTGVLGSPGQFEAAPPEGTQVGFMSTNGPRLMSQALSIGLNPVVIAANQSYDFSMMLGRRDTTTGSSGPYELFLAIRPVGDDAIDLLGAIDSASVLVDDAFTPKGSFAQAQFNLTTGANPAGLGEQVELVLFKASGGQGLLDSLSGSVVSIPEPSSVVITVIGLIGVLLGRKRYA